MSRAAWSFLRVMVWTNGVDFGFGGAGGARQAVVSVQTGGRARKIVRQKLAVEVEKKKWHEKGRRESPEFLDQTVLHEISRRIQP